MKLSGLRSAASIHEQNMLDPEYKREYERLKADSCEFHVRITSTGWITLDCKACARPVMSATHMDLWDLNNWAERHRQKRHPDGMPEAVVYRCPLTGEDESS